MTDGPQEDRLARLIEEVEELPFEAREAFLATLSDEDRAAVWATQLDEVDEVVPDDDGELGGEG